MLSVQNLQQHYPNFNLNVSFEVPNGEVVGLIGRNGAGKSTTFRAILNLIQPASGQLTLFDTPVDQLTPAQKQQIGTTFVDSFFAENFTINQLAKILKASYQNFDAQTFLQACEAQHLPLAKPTKAFSTGMKAKLKLLVAMSHQAQFLLLDEPTSGLDVVMRQSLLAMLQDYLDADAKRSVLLSSHISTDLETLCDRVIVLDQGQIRLQATIDDIQTHYATLKLTEAQYAQVKADHLLAAKPAPFGYLAVSDQRQYYQENYPQLAMAATTLDDLLVVLTQEADA